MRSESCVPLEQQKREFLDLPCSAYEVCVLLTSVLLPISTCCLVDLNLHGWKYNGKNTVPWLMKIMTGAVLQRPAVPGHAVHFCGYVLDMFSWEMLDTGNRMGPMICVVLQSSWRSTEPLRWQTLSFITFVLFILFHEWFINILCNIWHSAQKWKYPADLSEVHGVQFSLFGLWYAGKHRCLKKKKKHTESHKFSFQN